MFLQRQQTEIPKPWGGVIKNSPSCLLSQLLPLILIHNQKPLCFIPVHSLGSLSPVSSLHSHRQAASPPGPPEDELPAWARSENVETLRDGLKETRPFPADG